MNQIHLVYDVESGKFYSKKVGTGLESYTEISVSCFNKLVKEINDREEASAYHRAAVTFYAERENLDV